MSFMFFSLFFLGSAAFCHRPTNQHHVNFRPTSDSPGVCVTSRVKQYKPTLTDNVIMFYSSIFLVAINMLILYLSFLDHDLHSITNYPSWFHLPPAHVWLLHQGLQSVSVECADSLESSANNTREPHRTGTVR